MAGDVKCTVVHGALSVDGTGTADFTESGFGTPKACMIVMSFDTTDEGTIASEDRLSMGFSDFTTDVCVSHEGEDAQAAMDTEHRKTASKSYLLMDNTGAVDIDGGASTITDGVRLTNTTNASGSAVQVMVLMFGGADLNASVDVVIGPNGAGSTVETTTNIDQNLVLCLLGQTSNLDTTAGDIKIGFGVASINLMHDTFVNRAYCWSQNDGDTEGQPSSVIHNNRCAKLLSGLGNDLYGFELTAATATSYTLTGRDVADGGGFEIFALALDLNDRAFKVGSVDSPTSGATWTPSVSLGFTPQFVGIGLTQATAENTIELQNANGGSNGISFNAGSGKEACISWYEEDVAATSNCNCNFRSRAIDFRSDDVGTIIQDHSHSSFDADGWTYTINTENEGTARKWFYFAIEEAAAATPFNVTPRVIYKV